MAVTHVNPAAFGWRDFWALYAMIASAQAEQDIHLTAAIGYALADDKHQMPYFHANRKAYESG